MKKNVFALFALFVSTISISAQNIWGELFNAVNTVTQEVIKAQQQQYTTDNNSTANETNTQQSSSVSTSPSSQSNNQNKGRYIPCDVCGGTRSCFYCSGKGCFSAGNSVCVCSCCFGSGICQHCNNIGMIWCADCSN